MISLLRQYLLFLLWIYLAHFYEGISSELSKQEISLRLQGLEPLRSHQWNSNANESTLQQQLIHSNSNNFSIYPRGRLKYNSERIKNGRETLESALKYRNLKFRNRPRPRPTRTNNSERLKTNTIDNILTLNSFSDNSVTNDLNSISVATNSEINSNQIVNNNKLIDSVNVSVQSTSGDISNQFNSNDSYSRDYPGRGNPPSGTTSTGFTSTGAATEFRRHLVITPRVFHSRSKRSIKTTEETVGHIHHITLGLNLGEKDVVLDLQLNRNLIPERYFEKKVRKASHTIRRPGPKEVGMCHYQGFIKGVPGSWAAVSTCNGIRGVVYDGEDTHYLEPIPRVTHSLTDPHYLLTHRDLLPRNLTCGYKGRPDHPVRDLFHDETYNRLLRYKRSTPEGGIRGPFNSNSLSRYVELVLVADKTEFEKHNSDVNKINERCKDIANIVNALYQPLNIFIALVGVEVWEEEDPVEISTDGDKTLTNFLNYRKVRLIPEHPNDNAQLLTGKVFDSGVVGKALKGPICTYQYSGGVNMDHSDSVGLVATTVAHEMGHNFGMEHDSEEDCKCPDKRCIMAPSSGTKSPSHWSSCSHEYLAISFERSMDYCLRNKPTTLFDSPICGNGFVEAGEQCDCGLEEHCNNPCCNATTCMLFSNATCATGHCCDLQTCRPKSAGTECRGALHECDLPEYCSGDSEYCPDNFYKEDGHPCLGGKAYCYQGMCRTHDHQCRLLWGPTGKNSHDKCYNLNREGNTHGNCGYNWANNTYKKCHTGDIKCGMMHCKHFNERLEFGMESVSKVSHRFIADKKQGVIPCRVAQVDLGLDMVDPGLAPDGAKCGYNRMCVDQRCLQVSSLRTHVCNCNGQGVCNNLGHCHCDLGFSWPDCKYPGLGGSKDSGPASNPNASNHFVAFLFIFFLGVVPISVIILCLVYYVKGNLKLWWLTKGRPATSRLSGREGHRGASLCVEVVSKSPPTASTPDGAGSGGVRSPTPPSSQGSKSNSPLLNGHANGAPAGQFAAQLIGRYEGFTLSPIKEKSKGVASQFAGSQPPDATTLTDVTSSPITSPSGKATWRVKPSHGGPSSQGGGKTQVDISEPSLQTSTNPSVRSISPPVRTAPSLPANPPMRHAPQRPKSVPDASALIVGPIPTSVSNEEPPKDKPSAVARIASFLKKERADSPPLSEGSPKSNTLPRKAAKINRESLLQLEISHPMQLQATELPTNLVPVRPAPDPPMPSNVRPSDVKASQEKAPLSKVSWAPSLNVTQGETKKGDVDLPRFASVRETSVTSRPVIPKFGSMRAPRPKSLPPPRPSQPPPRPPLPMIPGTPESEYFYDDCITVQFAPLAPPEGGLSPSQSEGIYATIDESPERVVAPPPEGGEKKKGLFSMLYAKTKKKTKKEAQEKEPLYCNIEALDGDKEHAREGSSATPSPVIPDGGSCGSAEDGGGLLSEIVTELATREPQYVNTLSKKGSPKKGSAKDASPRKESSFGSRVVSPENDPKISESLPSAAGSAAPLNTANLKEKEKSPSLPSAKPDGAAKWTPSDTSSPYVPYSNLAPRGVFSFFKSPSNTVETSSSPPSATNEAVGKPDATPSPPKTAKPTLADSLAGVKAVSAATKSSVKTTPLAKASESEKQKIESKVLKSKDGPAADSASSKTKTPSFGSSNAHSTGRSRPVFPPDKVIHPPEKPHAKQSTATATAPSSVADKKQGQDTKTSSTVADKKDTKTSGTGIPKSKSGPPVVSSVKSKVMSPTTKAFSPQKDSGGPKATPAGKPSIHKQQSFDKKEGKTNTVTATKKKGDQPTSEDSKPAVKKIGKTVSPPGGSRSSSKSGVLAAAAKSGPQGTSTVASLSQKFEKDAQGGSKPPLKVLPKKPPQGKGPPKSK